MSKYEAFKPDFKRGDRVRIKDDAFEGAEPSDEVVKFRGQTGIVIAEPVFSYHTVLTDIGPCPYCYPSELEFIEPLSAEGRSLVGIEYADELTESDWVKLLALVEKQTGGDCSYGR